MGDKRAGERHSLRRRIRRWTVVITGLTFSVLTAASVIEEQHHVIAFQQASGEAMLLHLAQMTGTQTDVTSASAAVESMAMPLRASGIRLELVRPEAPEVGNVLARRPLQAGGKDFELRYAVDPRWAGAVTARAVAIHAVLGLIVMVATVVGIERILSRKLLKPLAAISHQVQHMRSGGGWEPRLPATDQELAGLADALQELGPALDAQVHQWIEAERRAALVTGLGQVREGMAERLRRALALLGDLQARSLVSPEGVRIVRASIRELEGLSGDIARAAADVTNAPCPPSAPNDRTAHG